MDPESIAVMVGIHDRKVEDTKIKEGPRDVSYDLFCFVLGVEKYGPFKTVADVDAYREQVVNSLVNAGLDVSMFYSIQEDQIYIRVGADDNRLLREADEVGYLLELDPMAMKTIAESDKCLPDRRPIHLEAPFDHHNNRIQQLSTFRTWVDMSDDQVTRKQHAETTLRPWDFLHAEYNESWEKYGKETFGVQIYKVYPSQTILRTTDRIKLLTLIMEKHTQHDLPPEENGAGLDIGQMKIKSKVLGAFALQHVGNLSAIPGEIREDELFAKWSTFRKFPWNQPIEDIRDYFGEKVALYFAFIGHYTMWLSVAAVIGLAVFIHQLVEVNDNTGAPNLFSATVLLGNNASTAHVVVYTEVPEVAIFAIFVAFWATLMLEFWKRKESRLAMQWGTSNFEATEVVRTEFVPTHFLPSLVTGRSEPYHAFSKFIVRVMFSAVIVLLYIGIALSAFIATIIFKVFASLDGSSLGLSQDTATDVALIINAIIIFILADRYRAIAIWLNNWENYRTDTQYEDALIIKTFVFSFVNSYATLFYLAFVRSGTDILGQIQLCEPAIDVNGTLITRDACFGNLGTSLLIIFLTQIILKNSLAVGIPALTGAYKKYQNTRVKKIDVSKTPADEANIPLMRSPCEDQFFKKSYEGTFDDFLKTSLQFGYATLFVAAFPLATFLAFVNCIIEIYTDSFKLCKLCSRPISFTAQDIGTWQTIYYTIAVIAVMTNAGVIFFTSHIVTIQASPGIDPNALRVWAWVISVLGVLVVKWVVSYLIPDIPAEVTIQLARQDYLVRKCLKREADDLDEEDDAEAGGKTRQGRNLVVHKVDPDLITMVGKIKGKVAANLDSIEEAFKAAETKKTVEVPTRVFQKILTDHGILEPLSADEVKLLMQVMDHNNNGMIFYADFLKLAKLGN